jgi:hypothetical protein
MPPRCRRTSSRPTADSQSATSTPPLIPGTRHVVRAADRPVSSPRSEATLGEVPRSSGGGRSRFLPQEQSDVGGGAAKQRRGPFPFPPPGAKRRWGRCCEAAEGAVPTNEATNPFTSCMQLCMLLCMHSTSVRIDQATHQELKRLARRLGTTVGETVALAVRRLRQDRIGEELSATLRRDEVDWLDADLG